MKRTALLFPLLALTGGAFAQVAPVAATATTFTVLKNNPTTSVKNQGKSGTCWCFSSTALVESELLKKNKPECDLSETFTVYNLYIDKAEKYIRRQGNTRFTEGGIQQDMLFSTNTYGMIPQSIYPGVGRDTVLNHDTQMEGKLKAYLDALLKTSRSGIPADWKDGYKKILNSYLGEPPATFEVDGKTYTPQTYAAENIPLKLSDYVGLTSFTHHPFYSKFAMEVPDNYNSNMFYNVPLNELIQDVKTALNKGYTIAWDADVSNKGFSRAKGIAMWANTPEEVNALPAFAEKMPDQQIRQQLFDKQETTDDHLMQITGIAKANNGKEFFIVKNSWGTSAGPYAGFYYVSIPYFMVNTISVLVNKKALPSKLATKASE